MTLAIDTEHLTKYYGENRGVVDVDLDVGRRRRLRLPRSQRRRQDDHDPRAARPHPSDVGHDRPCWGSTRAATASPSGARVGYLPGELRPVPQADRRRDAALLRQPARRRRLVLRRGARRAPRLRPDAPRRRPLDRQQAQAGPDPGAHAPPRAASSSTSPRSGLDPLVQREFYALVDEAREAGQTIFLSSHVLPEVQRVCEPRRLRPRGRLVAVEDVARSRQKAVHHVEIEFADAGAAGRARGARRRRRADRDRPPPARSRVTGTLDAVVKAAGASRGRRAHQPRARPRGPLPRYTA